MVASSRNQVWSLQVMASSTEFLWTGFPRYYTGLSQKHISVVTEMVTNVLSDNDVKALQVEPIISKAIKILRKTDPSNQNIFLSMYTWSFN